MPLLSLKNLTFTFTKPNLLENITLHIERGERIRPGWSERGRQVDPDEADSGGFASG
jgi:ABC-type iron transport system FetAB ATPase subunit